MRAPAVRRFGRVLDASAGYIVARNPDRVLSPDVSVISLERCPRLPEVGFIEATPELAAEVRSPRDSWLSVVEKGGVWIGHGARLVWCIDPRAETVLVLRPGEEPVERRKGDALRLHPMLDVEMPVSEVFAAL